MVDVGVFELVSTAEREIVSDGETVLVVFAESDGFELIEALEVGE